MNMTTMQVDPGDPHNDQVLAQTAQDITAQMEIILDVLNQAENQNAPLSSIMAVIAVSWVKNEQMTRDRMASLLALALIRNHAHILKDEASDLAEFIRRLKS